MWWRNRNFKKQFFVVVVVVVFFFYFLLFDTTENVYINDFFCKRKKDTYKHIKNRYTEDKVKVNCLNGFIAFYSLLSFRSFRHFMCSIPYVIYTYLLTYTLFFQQQKMHKVFFCVFLFVQMNVFTSHFL